MMALWFYKAVARSGGTRDKAHKPLSGQLEAVDRSEALEILNNQGLRPYQLRESSPSNAVFRRINRWLEARRFRDGLLAQMTRELGDLMAAGLSLDEALAAVQALPMPHAAKGLVEDLRRQVRSGRSFGDALSGHPEVFPDFYVSLVRSGEVGGHLEGALQRLAQLMERAQASRDKVRSALLYPMLLLFMMAVIMVGILSFVVPAFQPFFEETGRSLPRSTRIVLWLGSLMSQHGPVLFLVLALLIFVSLRLFSHPVLALKRDRWVLSSPLLFGLPVKRDLSEFFQTLGALLSEGARLQIAFDRAVAVVGNLHLRAELSRVGVVVREGASLSAALQKLDGIPDLAVRMIGVGERSGRLPAMLMRTGAQFERDVDLAISKILSMLVPILTVVMGLLVAGFVGSILVGLMEVTNFG